MELLLNNFFGDTLLKLNAMIYKRNFTKKRFVKLNIRLKKPFNIKTWN